MTKKITAAILAFAMLFTFVLPITDVQAAGANVDEQQPAVTTEYVAQIGDKGYATLQEAVDAANAGDTIKLTKDITVDSLSAIEKGITFDLNGKTLTYTGTSSIQVKSSNTCTIKNGKIKANKFSGGTVAFIKVLQNASLLVDGVQVYTNGSAFFPIGDAKNEDVAKLTINNSKVYCGTYAVGTNASEDNKVAIELNNSEFTTDTDRKINDGDSCAVMMNVSGQLNMTGCTVNGTRQGLMIRGGTANIKNSTINLKSTKGMVNGTGGSDLASANKDKYWESDWKSGNEVPMAAVVVGNRSQAYNYPATCTLDNVNVTAADGYKAVYAYGMQDESRKVTLNVQNSGLYTGDVVVEGTVTKAITGGYFTSNPSDYVVSGKTVLPSDKLGFDFMVGDKPAVTPTPEAKPAQPAQAPAQVPANTVTGSEADKALADSVDTEMKTTAPEVTGPALEQAAQNEAKKNDKTINDAATKLKDVVKDANADNTKIVVQQFVEVKVTGANATATADKPKSIQVEITPKVQTVATKIETKNQDIKTGTNAVVIQEPKPITINEPVTISLKLPDNFADNGPLYVKHTKGGKDYIYKGTVTDNVLTFVSLHGLSPFVINVDEPAAKIGEIGYATLKEAIEDATTGAHIVLQKDNTEVITIDKAIQFDINANNKKFNPANIKAGDNVTRTENNGIYTFVIKPAKSYTITATTGANGTVSVNPTSATEGTEVTITTTPAEGYVLDTLTVKDGAGKAVTVTDNKFKMPASNVTVKATFKKAEYKVTVDSAIKNGTVTVSPKAANEGDTITVTATPSKGYKLKTLTYKKGSDKAVAIVAKDGKYTFTMPNGSVKVSAEFVKIPDTKYAVTIAVADHGKVTVDKTSAKETDMVTITATPDYGYEVKDVVVTDKNGAKLEVVAVDGKPNQRQFQMTENGPVMVTVTFKLKDGMSASSFIDVPKDAWFADAVEYVSMNDLMKGYPDGTFKPNASTDRAMIVTMLYRMEGSPAVIGTNTFSDVAEGQWYSKAVKWASKNGIVKGYTDGTFLPSNNITREEMAAIFHRYAAYKNYDQTAIANIDKFTDAAKISGWAKADLQWAVYQKLINGMGDGSVAPQGTATRAQAATVIMNFCENVAK